MKTVDQVFDLLKGTFQTNRTEPGWNILWEPENGRITKMIFGEMIQTIKFNPLPGITKNPGIDGEGGYLRNVRYGISITDMNNNPIHDEHGYISMDVTQEGLSPNPMEGFIARSGSIPRKLAFLTTGKLTLRPVFAAMVNYTAIPTIANPVSAYPATPTEMAEIGNQISAAHEQILAKGGPDIYDPIPWLDDLNQEEVWNFSFTDKGPHDSGTISGLGQAMRSPVGVGTLLSDIWIAGERDLRLAQIEDNFFCRFRFPHIGLDKLAKV